MSKNMATSSTIGVARGCSGCTCTPRAVKKNVRRNLQGKFVSAPPAHQVHRPQAEQESILGHFLLVGGELEVYLIDLDCLLRATTIKRSSTFF